MKYLCEMKDFESESCINDVTIEEAISNEKSTVKSPTEQCNGYPISMGYPIELNRPSSPLLTCVLTCSLTLVWVCECVSVWVCETKADPYLLTRIVVEDSRVPHVTIETNERSLWAFNYFWFNFFSFWFQFYGRFFCVDGIGWLVDCLLLCWCWLIESFKPCFLLIRLIGNDWWMNCTRFDYHSSNFAWFYWVIVDLLEDLSWFEWLLIQFFSFKRFLRDFIEL